MPYVRPGAAKDGGNSLPSHLQLKKREQPTTEEPTAKSYTGMVGSSGSILTNGILPKNKKEGRIAERTVAFFFEPSEDQFSTTSSVDGDASDNEPDMPDGLDSFEFSPKDTEPNKAEHPASGSKDDEETPIETAIATLEINQSDALANRSSLSAHGQQQLARKAKAEKTE